MNRVFRLAWSRHAGSWILAAGCGSALALPQGPQVVAGGAGSIASAGGSMTINQHTERMAINWQRFGIAAGETVRFQQPNPSAIALNRVLGTEASQINGQLISNGQVWLLNPNGVLFGAGASVNVGSLLASTLSISDSEFFGGHTRFGGASGTVSNAGSIIADKGYVALLGGRVSNDGIIRATLGNVTLAAGGDMTLYFGGDRLLGVQVAAGAANALAINTSSGQIYADGGSVLLTAKSAEALLQTAVNNSGRIRARSLDASGSVIRLSASPMDGVLAGGWLDTSAGSAAAAGGLIETAGARVILANGLNVSSHGHSPQQNGRWLIESDSFTVAAAGGDAAPSELNRALAQGNVEVRTKQSIYNPSGSDGDISINAPLAWSNANSLTLSAFGKVNVNANLGLPAGGRLALRADNNGACVAGAGVCATVAFNGARITGSGGTVDIYSNPPGSSNPANADGIGPSYETPTDYTGAVDHGHVLRSWMLINDVNQLQALPTNVPSAYFALGRDIDAYSTRNWNGGAGFASIGVLMKDELGFAGTLDGLGHSVHRLYIGDRGGSTHSQSGLFAAIGATGQVSNLSLTSADIRNHFPAALAGINQGVISNVVAYGAIESLGAGPDSLAGGLVGVNYGTIRDSAALVDIAAGTSTAGALAGRNHAENGAAGLITGSYARGSLNGGGMLGGLVGDNLGNIVDSYADVAVQGVSMSPALGAVGGLAGSNGGTISNSYATGRLATGSPDLAVGGLAGQATPSGMAVNSYWDIGATGASLPYGRGSGDANALSGSRGLDGAAMKQAASFAGWDFSRTWRIYEGQTAPLLKSFLTPLVVRPDDVHAMYSGGGYDLSRLTRQLQFSIPEAATSPQLLSAGPPFAAGSPVNAGSYGYALRYYSNQAGYDIRYAASNTGVLTITPAPLFITANNAVKIFDGQPFSGGNGYTVSGLLGADTVGTVFFNEPVYVGSAQNASAVGVYRITPCCVRQTGNNNYVPLYRDGVLAILSAPVVPPAPVTPPGDDTLRANPLYTLALAYTERQLSADPMAVSAALDGGSEIIIHTVLSDQIKDLMKAIAEGFDPGEKEIRLSLSKTADDVYQYSLGLPDQPGLVLEAGSLDIVLALLGARISPDQRSLWLNADGLAKVLQGVSSKKGIVTARTLTRVPGASPMLKAAAPDALHASPAHRLASN